MITELTAHERNGKRSALYLFALVLVVASAYLGVLYSGFVNLDDPRLVMANGALLSPTLQNLTGFWTTLLTNNLELFSPLSYTLWWCTARLFGMNAMAFHGVNLLLHLANCIMAYLLLRRMLQWLGCGQFIDAACLAAASVFGLHPVQVEAVTWVSGMNGVLASTFSLAALLAFCKYLDGPRPGDRWKWLSVATALTAIGGLCKPTAVVTPALAVVMGLFIARAPWKIVVWGGAGMLSAALPFAVINVLIQQSGAGGSLLCRPLIVADTLAFYVVHVIFPWPLLPDYGRVPFLVITHWLDRPLWLVTPVALGAAVLAWRRGSRVSLACLFWMAFAVAPVSGLVPFYHQAFSTVADRYAYMAMLGPALIIGMMVARIRKPRHVALLICALVMALGLATWNQVRHWKSAYTWCEHLLAYRPDSILGNGALGDMLWRMGKVEEALVCMDRVVDTPLFVGSRHLIRCRMLIAAGQAPRALKGTCIMLDGARDLRQAEEVAPVLVMAAEATGQYGVALDAVRRLQTRGITSSLINTYAAKLSRHASTIPATLPAGNGQTRREPSPSNTTQSGAGD